ncbi:transglycosylase SLT domain-containing protein [Lichenicoccus sp.]|uniref:transglycosylase SLT domain-containing protein n=1 Tax=Lichenicoccus sp. TaxID=2781899 RepID=UPI003D0B8AEA
MMRLPRLARISLAWITLVVPNQAFADTACSDAARDAERSAGLPSGLLSAIGYVESGGRPWSVNSGQQGVQFTTRDAASSYVQGLLDQGRRIIDVGCFQVDLYYHPEAFARWQDGLDPMVNATAASRILQDLHARTGDWNQAVALYHSADPMRGMPYMQAVLRSWSGGAGTDAPPLPAWSDPFTILVSAQASAITVWTPEGAQNGARGRNRGTPRGLPRIITP